MTQFYTINQIRSRRVSQVALSFSMPRSYTEATDQQIADNANGVGPDFCPSAVRAALTFLEPYLDLAADIHDVEFRLSDDQRGSYLRPPLQGVSLGADQQRPTITASRAAVGRRGGSRAGLFRVNLAPDYCGCARRSGRPRSAEDHARSGSSSASLTSSPSPLQ